MKSEEKVPNRIRYLEPYITGKKLLHLGCVRHDWQESLSSDWIHAFLEKYADTTGIDILESDIEELKKRGFNVQQGNAEEFDLNTTFDVIFAGELVEHLENLKGFCDSCKRHMSTNSLLIITTPNSFGIRYWIRYAAIRKKTRFNTEHKCWFDSETISTLLEHNGFEVVRVDYLPLDSPTMRTPWRQMVGALERAFPQFAPVLLVIAQLKI
jgi:predicted TPR repeat methyltransferase